MKSLLTLVLVLVMVGSAMAIAPTQAPVQKPTQAPVQKHVETPTQKAVQAPVQKGESHKACRESRDCRRPVIRAAGRVARGAGRVVTAPVRVIRGGAGGCGAGVGNGRVFGGCSGGVCR